MPEGHLYHRYARLQQDLVTGEPVEITSPQGRFAAEAGAVTGRPIAAVTARGKNVFHHVEGGAVIHVHLGMQGVFLHGDGTGEPKKQVRLRLAVPDETNWDLIAPATCALIDEAQHDDVVGRLGPDPLDPHADCERAVANLHSAGQPIGAALLDQRLISGVGNVFRAEALLAVGIHPSTPAEHLDVARLNELWRTLVELMTRAEAAGEIAPKRIYKQERCAICGTPTTTSTVAGRTAYTCDHCQRAA